MGRWRGHAFSDFVYVITGSHGMTKIGVSADPAARLAALQTGSAHHLVLAHAVPINGDAYAAEAEAHALLARYRQIGEWFAVPAEVAVAAVSAAAFRFSRTAELVEKKPRWLIRYALLTAIATPVWTFPTPIPFAVVMIIGSVWLSFRLIRTRGQWSMRLGAQWAGVFIAAILTSLVFAAPFVSAAHAEGATKIGGPKSDGSFPKFDYEVYCYASNPWASKNDLFGLMEDCRKEEEEARDLLRSVWEKLLVMGRSDCADYAGTFARGSYVRLRNCVGSGLLMSFRDGNIARVAGKPDGPK